MLRAACTCVGCRLGARTLIDTWMWGVAPVECRPTRLLGQNISVHPSLTALAAVGELFPLTPHGNGGRGGTLSPSLSGRPLGELKGYQDRIR
jgi:hypothetical protein